MPDGTGPFVETQKTQPFKRQKWDKTDQAKKNRRAKKAAHDEVTTMLTETFKEHCILDVFGAIHEIQEEFDKMVCPDGMANDCGKPMIYVKGGFAVMLSVLAMSPDCMFAKSDADAELKKLVEQLTSLGVGIAAPSDIDTMVVWSEKWDIKIKDIHDIINRALYRLNRVLQEAFNEKKLLTNDHNDKLECPNMSITCGGPDECEVNTYTNPTAPFFVICNLSLGPLAGFNLLRSKMRAAVEKFVDAAENFSEDIDSDDEEYFDVTNEKEILHGDGEVLDVSYTADPGRRDEQYKKLTSHRELYLSPLKVIPDTIKQWTVQISSDYYILLDLLHTLALMVYVEPAAKLAKRFRRLVLFGLIFQNRYAASDPEHKSKRSKGNDDTMVAGTPPDKAARLRLSSVVINLISKVVQNNVVKVGHDSLDDKYLQELVFGPLGIKNPKTRTSDNVSIGVNLLGFAKQLKKDLINDCGDYDKFSKLVVSAISDSTDFVTKLANPKSWLGTMCTIPDGANLTLTCDRKGYIAQNSRRDSASAGLYPLNITRAGGRAAGSITNRVLSAVGVAIAAAACLASGFRPSGL